MSNSPLVLMLENICNLIFFYLLILIILGLGLLFTWFWVNLILFKSSWGPSMVGYQLGSILEYVLLSIKFYEAFKLASIGKRNWNSYSI